MIKKILIVGENSFIGNNFLNFFNNDFEIHTLDAHKPLKEESFVGFDVVLHLAAIVHKKETIFNKHLYDEVNYKLAVKCATLAKSAKVSQFIFMSTMALYGKDLKISKTYEININSDTLPTSYYGASKLKAEKEIKALEDGLFKIMIIRSPMVYGENAKGNYAKLLKIAKITHFVPDISNKRSSISIANLCNFIKHGINNNLNGIFFPQDKEFICTKDIIINYRKMMGKKVRVTKFFNPLIYFLSTFFKSLRKVFGSKVYEIGDFKPDVGVRY